MRILLVTPMPPRPEAPGAIPLVFHALLTGLRQRHDITLLTVVGDEPGEVEAAEIVRRSGLDIHVVDRRRPSGVARQRRRARLAATWARGRYPWRTVWFADPAVQRTLDGLARTGSFDLVAVEDSSMGAFRLPAHLPSVLTEHEVKLAEPIYPSDDLLRRRPRSLVQKEDLRRWPGYQSAVWRKFDRLQVFTRRDANLVTQRAPDVRTRVRVNPFGIALPCIADPAREVSDSLLFMGNFTHEPNVDAAGWLAREILPRVKETRPSAELRIVGGSAPDELRALSGNGVQFLGEVATIGPHLEAASVVVAPVRQGAGMRMKVLQALAFGKPVVTTSLGAEGLLIASHGPPPLVIADDADTIAAQITRLLDDADLRHVLGARARTFAARHHSPEAYAARLEDVYAETVAVAARRAGGPAES